MTGFKKVFIDTAPYIYFFNLWIPERYEYRNHKD